MYVLRGDNAQPCAVMLTDCVVDLFRTGSVLADPQRQFVLCVYLCVFLFPCVLLFCLWVCIVWPWWAMWKAGEQWFVSVSVELRCWGTGLIGCACHSYRTVRNERHVWFGLDPISFFMEAVFSWMNTVYVVSKEDIWITLIMWALVLFVGWSLTVALRSQHQLRKKCGVVQSITCHCA